jgi:hypothetical protein
VVALPRQHVHFGRKSHFHRSVPKAFKFTFEQVNYLTRFDECIRLLSGGVGWRQHVRFRADGFQLTAPLANELLHAAALEALEPGQFTLGLEKRKAKRLGSEWFEVMSLFLMGVLELCDSSPPV